MVRISYLSSLNLCYYFYTIECYDIDVTETMIFKVNAVIVCDLKALGMSTGMGGGSSKTKFHCIWNAVRREEKGIKKN